MAGHRNLYCLISSVYCQMPPNTRIKFDKKRSHKTRHNSYLEEEVQDCRDGSGLRLIFGQTIQKSKLSFWRNFEPFISHFFLLVEISL